jgi:outer membrane protein OmpA-like peptidoglycan-associated protein
VNKDEIVISQKVEFIVGGAEIMFRSEQVLEEVKDAILAHPEILLIEVQGHTDDSGDREWNMGLSQRRADAVRKWLIENGVQEHRLIAKGYGYTRPLEDNRFREGRERNRRVQFVIVRQTKRKGDG